MFPQTAFRDQARLATRLIFAVGGIVLGAWAPLVPLAKLRLGVEEGALGLLLLCMGVGSILAMPLTALLTARFGCRQVITVSAAGLCLILPLLATAGSIWLMAVALVGAGEAVADRVAGGEIEVDAAADLLENLAWRGLAGKKTATT